MALGLWYGQPVSQMLRDVRYPLCYALFFVVTGFFDLKGSRTFLGLLVVSSAVVGLEYLGEFLDVVNLSISGSFYRVFRIEGLMLPIGTLGITALLLYDTALHRRAFAAVAAVPVVLALEDPTAVLPQVGSAPESSALYGFAPGKARRRSGP